MKPKRACGLVHMVNLEQQERSKCYAARGRTMKLNNTVWLYAGLRYYVPSRSETHRSNCLRQYACVCLPAVAFISPSAAESRASRTVVKNSVHKLHIQVADRQAMPSVKQADLLLDD